MGKWHKGLKNAIERKELSILDSNSFFGKLDLLIDQLDSIDLNCVSEDTRAIVEELQRELKGAQLIAEELEKKL